MCVYGVAKVVQVYMVTKPTLCPILSHFGAPINHCTPLVGLAPKLSPSGGRLGWGGGGGEGGCIRCVTIPTSGPISLISYYIR